MDTRAEDTPPNAQPVNPYIGPRSFKTGEKLYGRDAETRHLLDLLIAERIVLLHSPSGAGKSSLIRAGLMPLIEAEDFRVLPVVRVNLDVPPSIPRPGRVNRYVFSFMLSCEEALPEDQRLPIEQLAAISMELGFINRRARATFDLLAGLGNTAASRPAERTESRTEVTRIRSLEDYLVQRLHVAPTEDCVLIFDQFEEVLTANPYDVDVKTAFFTQLGAALRDRRRWALFAMREDYIAALTPFLRYLPGRLAATFRLDLLRAEAAKEALQKPACQAGIDFTDEATQKLVDDLRRVQVQNPDGTTQEQLGPTVEPVQLQVVGYRLWAGLPPNTPVISVDNLAAIGTVDQSLADYYAEHTATVAQETGVKERAIREWFDRKLITEHELRGQVLLGVEQSEGVSNRAIHRLEDAHLVRSEKRVGATWFELAHDRLIKPIKANNAEWFQAHLSLLQRQAEVWNTQNHPEGLLLRDEALAEAETWAASHAEAMTPVEQDFMAACRKAQAQAKQERRRNQITRLLAIAASIAAVVAVIFGAMSAVATRAVVAQSDQRATAVVVADNQREIALTVQAQAVTQQAIADFQRQIAVTAQAQAVEQQANADRQRQIAVGAQAQAEAASTEVVSQANMRATSEAATRQTLSQLYANQAREALNGDLSLALLLGVEADTVYDSPEARQVLTDAVHLSQSRTVQLQGRQPPRQQHAIYSVAFNPAGDKLAWGSSDNSIAIWNMQQQEVETRVQASRRTIISPTLAYDPTGSLLAWSGKTGVVTLWDPQTAKMAASLYQIITPIDSLAFSPDGSMLAAGTTEGNTVLWTMTDHSVKRYLTGSEGDIRTVAWAHDGRLAAGSGSSVRIWNVLTGETIVKLGGVQSDTLTSLVWSPDGAWLATGSFDGSIVLWDAATGKPMGTPAQAGSPIFSLAISPDGHTLASGQNDHTISVWDVTNTNNVRAVAKITDHTSTVTSLAFSPQSTLLAAADLDGSVTIYRIATEQVPDQPLPTMACLLAKRNFTQAEWKTYFPGQNYQKTCDQWPEGR